MRGDGTEILAHACELGCKSIVSLRLGSRYTSGRTDMWLKIKNASVVSRQAEEEWGS